MRLVLLMPTGFQVGYDNYFSSEPLGIETLAAHARRHADVSLLDMRRRGHDIEAHAELVLAQSPDMVGMSINSAPHTNYSLALAAAIKRRRKDLPILAGGQQATFLTEELLMPGVFDAVVRSEGELTLSEILSRGRYEGVAGVSWMDAGAVRNEPDRPLIENLDDVEMPCRDLLPDRRNYRMGAYRVEGIESSRGCAFGCSFCSIRNFHRGRWRPKSVARVMREVDYILEHYPEKKVIYFADDCFSTDIRRVEAICKEIVERRTEAYFWCQARVDQLSRHPEVVEWMGKAHFAAVLTGIETPVPRLLKASRKGTSMEQVQKTIELLHAHDIGVWGTFTLGLPGETPQESEQTADFIPQTKVDVAQITVVTPIPGSTLYDEAKANGDLLSNDWDQYDFTSPLMKGQLPKKQMDALMQRAYLRVYMSRRFFKSVFTQRTNLDRLRRTAFSVFWWFIFFVIRMGIQRLFQRRPAAPLQPKASEASSEAVSVEDSRSGNASDGSRRDLEQIGSAGEKSSHHK